MPQAIYPGSFDPITNGHLDIIRRAGKLFQPLTVAVSQQSPKDPAFSAQERARLIQLALKEGKITADIRVEIFDTLLVDYLLKKKAAIVVRGLRFISDFEYEFQMALTNRRLLRSMETVFLMPDEKYTYISSSLVREITKGGRSPKEFVPRCVEKALREKLL